MYFKGEETGWVGSNDVGNRSSSCFLLPPFMRRVPLQWEEITGK